MRWVRCAFGNVFFCIFGYVIVFVFCSLIEGVGLHSKLTLVLFLLLIV